jgi:hypothetical protein
MKSHPTIHARRKFTGLMELIRGFFASRMMLPLHLLPGGMRLALGKQVHAEAGRTNLNVFFS